MDAFFARNRLSAYLDGELGASEAREVEAALARDSGLRAEFDAMRHAVDSLRAHGVVHPPVGFADRLSARLEREPMPTGWRRWSRQIRMEGVLLAAAALLVVGYVGHKAEAPVLPTPGEAVSAGDAFGATGEQGAGAELPLDPASVQAPTEASSPTSSSASATPLNDGVLGNEGGAPASASPPAAATKPAPLSKSQSLAQRMPKIGTSNAPDVEPWRAEWEKEGDATADVYGGGGSSSNTGNTASRSDAQQGISFYSPAPFRYRVNASDERALKALAAIAKELGGQLQDSRGRPVAAWLLEEGESRTVRVAVPAYNASTLAARLRELGAVEAIKEDETLVTDPNAPLPIQVELAF